MNKLKENFYNWRDNLTGWKWWLYEIGGVILFFAIVEVIVYQVGYSVLPWRWIYKE